VTEKADIPTEVISGPADLDWMKEPTEKPPVSSPKDPVRDRAEAAMLIARLVALGHAQAANVTGYSGWRLDEEETRTWEGCIKFAIKDMELKNLPAIVMFASLAFLEGGKVMGYMRFRKDSGAPPIGLGGFGKGRGRKAREQQESGEPEQEPSEPAAERATAATPMLNPTAFVDHIG
jgi:hypothetical protein